MSCLKKIFSEKTTHGDEQHGDIFYHYTSSRGADAIARAGVILKNDNGVLLTTMTPEHYYRDEILYNNYGDNISQHLQNRADYCVKVHSNKLSKNKLKTMQPNNSRLIYLYQDDIHVNARDVYDKPKCNRTTYPMQSDIQERQQACQQATHQLNQQASQQFSEHLNTQQRTHQQPSHSYSNEHDISMRKSSSTLIKISTRNDIQLHDTEHHQDVDVTIFAFEWLKNGLQIMQQKVNKEILLDITDCTGKNIRKNLIADFTLKSLQIMSRNEASNTNGEINFEKYFGIDKEVIYSLKDLVRQTVIVGRDYTTHYGGYPHDNIRVPQEESVYVCDLIGLQFQQQYNSGRLVTVGEYLPKGLLDEFIYEQVVKESKPTIAQVRSDYSGRFVECAGVFFDTKAYVKFVANDVLITGMALNHCANEPLNFKFLKYGIGYFAGPFRSLLERFIGQGVAEGLLKLLERLPRQHLIRRIELPFFNQNPEIDYVCAKHNIKLAYGRDDCLKKTHTEYATATTNCADPHAMTGNKMGFGSIDGAIAENLFGKAIKFSPIINKLIQERYIQ